MAISSSSSEYYSPNNLNGIRRPGQASVQQGGSSSGPYAGGFRTDYNFVGGTRASGDADYSSGNGLHSGGDSAHWIETDPNSSAYKSYQQAQGQSNDSDYKQMLRAQWERDNPNAGTSYAEQNALYNMYKGRVAKKNTLSDQIGGAGGLLQDQLGNLNAQAGADLNQGTKTARQNYNSRGLLYSGMREAGEQGVRGAVAGSLASGSANARRESENSVNAAKSAYSAVGLASEQEQIQLAQQAFDTANANSIARMQAMQQLGSSIGNVGGLAAGYYNANQAKQIPQQNNYNNFSYAGNQTDNPGLYNRGMVG